jgi:hypothetical protein
MILLLLLGAGKDCTALFDKYHRWVNIDSMLSKCVVGILMNDENVIKESEEENDDDCEQNLNITKILENDKKSVITKILNNTNDNDNK